MANCLLSSLLCAEDNTSICYDDDHHNNIKNLETETETECCVVDLPVQSDECLAILIDKECQQFVGFDYFNKLRNGKLDIVARQQAVDWILKVHAHFKFGPLCAYLSINYLDRFLAAYDFPKDKAWMMQLLAVTCLSLATKMEETEIPHIVDLQVCESRYVFEAKTIQKMELLVLTTLKWRMQTVTPFSFIDAFIGKLDCGQPLSRALISRSTQLILRLINGIDFLEFRPSEIAAGVTISVVGQSQIAALLKHVQKDRILKCVELVNELSSGCTKSINSGTVPQSPIGVLEAACLSCNQSEDSVVESSTNKRRRLNNRTLSHLEL
ncbi:hypothetical protein M8C21_028893 [Ambrosia artemisiifolia]|uniref:Cyclin N-terminal domain-containing protein n=1 Tax=Ambrosia artemisiifolia TaxID=4212 RepID=A0AAD5D589_AMBAR|nr:hypothetical protein M8C21_028893 [Ambrosia artemisiifolia]